MDPDMALTATDLPTDSPATDAPIAPSKSALKKAARAQRYAATKLERRAKEKEAKKEKKRQKAEKRAAGELDEQDEEEEKNRRAKKPRRTGPPFGGRVVVDLGFDEMMNDKEIISLCSQLAYTYSANRQASYPFSLVYTSLNGRTFTRLESMSDAGYKRWANTEWWTEGYERLWQGPVESTLPIHETTKSADDVISSVNKLEEDHKPSSSTHNPQHNDVKHAPDTSAQERIVYLTADSEDELTELKADETYIIGGIVDHNRYKNLCLNKAKDSGIRTARLPIGRYLASLPTRKVLTVNQVFEILLRWVETKDWEDALHSVVPKRKFQTAGSKITDKKEGTSAEKENEGGEGEGLEESSLVILEELEQDVDDEHDG